MRVVVVYESMFGNSRAIAQAIGEGLEDAASDDQIIDVDVVNVNAVTPEALRAADLLVLGGPTHVRGMTRASTRREAAKWADDPLRDLVLEPEARGRGVREFLSDPATVLPPLYATFATRADTVVLLGGDAAGLIARALRKRLRVDGLASESFFVTKSNCLEEGEWNRAREWASHVGHAAAAIVAHRGADGDAASTTPSAMA